MKCAAENFRFSVITRIENPVPIDGHLRFAEVAEERVERGVRRAAESPAITWLIQRGRLHEALALAVDNVVKARDQRQMHLLAEVVGEVGDFKPVEAAEQTIDEIADLAVAVEIEALDAKRLGQRQQPIHAVLVALRAHRAVPAALEARSNRGNADASVAERNGMKNVAVRSIAEQIVKGAPVVEQVPPGPACDLVEEGPERLIRAIGEANQLDELVFVVFLTARKQRRPFAVEDEAQRADAHPRVISGIR